MLAKPADEAEAARFLRLLSGRRHRVITAIAARTDGETRVKPVETAVRFRRLSDEEISTLSRDRGMARQGRRLCHPRRGGGVHSLDQRIVFQRGRIAARRDGRPSSGHGICGGEGEPDPHRAPAVGRTCGGADGRRGAGGSADRRPGYGHRSACRGGLQRRRRSADQGHRRHDGRSRGRADRFSAHDAAAALRGTAHGSGHRFGR